MALDFVQKPRVGALGFLRFYFWLKCLACIRIILLDLIFFFLTDQEIQEVKSPGFSESISEGDIRWDKGMSCCQL